VISRLQKIHLVTDQINDRVKSIAALYDATLDAFSDLFEVLTNQYAPEFEKYHLDEIVVAAMAPTVRDVWSYCIPGHLITNFYR
jgi:tuftelin-interacting protein 11